MKYTKIVFVYLIGISCALLLVFLWWHWQLGLTRYFDVDEFAHLHWSYHMLSGSRPYVDFLFFFPPGFHWFLMPLFAFGGGITPVIAGRILAFIVFVALVVSTMTLFWLVRRSWIAVVAGIILAFLPLPFDKFLEIRPDTLAAVLVMLGIFFQIRWMRGKPTQLHYNGLLSGILYAISLIVLPKTLPSIMVGILVAFVWLYQNTGTSGLAKLLKNGKLFALGFVAPCILFFLWLVTLGNFDIVWYSLIKLPIEANKMGQYFYMSPDLFFYPNEAFYGVGGYSIGLVINHFVWVVGLIIAVYRLFTPYVGGERDRALEEVLLAGIVLTNVVLYIGFIPLKHTQYLIPISVFVAWFVADGVNVVWNQLSRKSTGLVIFSVFFTLGVVYLYQINDRVVQPKTLWTNKESLIRMNNIFTQIPFSEHILDLDGRTLYYPDPYYACCLPFGQFGPLLSRPLPSLADELEKTNTKYIYQGQLHRVDTLLPQDQSYIRSRYKPSDASGELLIRRDL